jgi:muramoyltetrapeptide carboxypeptidase
MRPRPLHPGDPVAVVAPASPPRRSAEYRAGLEALRALYEVREHWTAGAERGYLAAPDPVRAEALNAAIASPAIRAVICLRGGYGSLRLLSRIDWESARSHPTLLVGYSDVTALHLAFYARSDWIGVSGPVVTEWAKLDADTLDPFRRLVETGTLSLDDAALRPVNRGTATGPLLGGNLSVLSRLVGTPFAPDWDDAILVLEDVAEAPYRIDRMLSHLQHAGVLDEVGGVVLGDFGDGATEADEPTLSLETVFADYFDDRPYPVATDLPYGHVLPRYSLPIGAPVELSVAPDGATLTGRRPIVAPADASGPAR